MNPKTGLAALVARAGLLEPVAAGVAHVALQAAGALDQAVDGCEVADDDVPVGVEALFDDLGRDDQLPATHIGCAQRAEALEDNCLDSEPV